MVLLKKSSTGFRLTSKSMVWRPASIPEFLVEEVGSYGQEEQTPSTENQAMLKFNFLHAS